VVILSTLTSRNALFYTEVEGEVSVQQWRTILVDNVPGSYAPEMAQPSLFVSGKYRRGWRESADALTKIKT